MLWIKKACKVAHNAWDEMLQPEGWFENLFGSSTPDHRLIPAAIESYKSHKCMVQLLLDLDERPDAHHVMMQYMEVLMRSRELSNALERARKTGKQVWQVTDEINTSLHQ